MLRKIIKPTSENYVIHIPNEYLNKKVEILVLPYTQNKDKNYKNIKFAPNNFGSSAHLVG